MFVKEGARTHYDTRKNRRDRLAGDLQDGAARLLESWHPRSNDQKEGVYAGAALSDDVVEQVGLAVVCGDDRDARGGNALQPHVHEGGNDELCFGEILNVVGHGRRLANAVEVGDVHKLERAREARVGELEALVGRKQANPVVLRYGFSLLLLMNKHLFKKYIEEVCSSEDAEYFMEKYDDWTKAFSISAQKGALILT